MRQIVVLTLLGIALAVCAGATGRIVFDYVDDDESGASARQGGLPQPLLEAEFIATGDVLSSVQHPRQVVGGGTPRNQRTWHDFTDMRIALRRVFLGVSTSDTLEATMLTAIIGNRKGFRPGARVLVWGSHVCEDGMRLWCQLAVYSDHEHGYQYVPIRQSSRAGRATRTRIRESAIRAECTRGVLASRSKRQLAIADVVACTVTDMTRAEGTGAVLHCARIDTSATPGAEAMIVVHATTVARWWADIAVGDTLVIPRTAREKRTSRVDMAESPIWFKSRWGLVQWFGCPRSQVREALEPGRVRGELQLRRKARDSR